MSDLGAWIASFREQLTAYLSIYNVQRQQLADMIGFTPSAVSKNLGEGRSPSEAFIKAVDQNVLGMAGCYRSYLMVKAGDRLADVAAGKTDFMEQLSKDQIAEAAADLQRMADQFETMVREFEERYGYKPPIAEDVVQGGQGGRKSDGE